jgi:hypothetical protein
MSKKITIWGDIEKPAVAIKGPKRGGPQAGKVEPKKLAQNFTEFLSSFEDVVRATPQTIAQYSVSEITLNLGISVAGEVGLIGKVGVGLETGVSVTLKRP